MDFDEHDDIKELQKYSDEIALVDHSEEETDIEEECDTDSAEECSTDTSMGFDPCGKNFSLVPRK